ncbi:MAG TPA: FmdB family zinc ribbon protein [Gemmatimonadaceae bacterium]|nr:FmdB family zinc ribbon protein [Gemmatimonadaceae bacterium]
MPIYEYACQSGHRSERFVRRIGDAEETVACPVCGQPAARVISGAGLVFKGSGFYITDYGKDGKKAQTPPPAKTEGGKSDAPAAPKSDSAPAAKPKGGE